jgi:hypothetical protein
MKRSLQAHEVFGFVRPAVDAHTLGISSVEQLLTDCGYASVIADATICAAADNPSYLNNLALLERWVRQQGITRLGFSYRLDPREGAHTFGKMLHLLRERHLFVEQGGPLAGVCFAGLPEACARVKRDFEEQVEVFTGDETPAETLIKLGVPPERIPTELNAETAYDERRLEFARDLLKSERHLQVKPVGRSGYPTFGTAQDTLIARIQHGREHNLPPLMRAHVGPYLPDRTQAVTQFLDWARQLAQSGLLDILSIGTSQLSQSNFGEEWGEKRNGGGVPINSVAEFRAVWEAARPMLVRTYAGTQNIPQMARMYEETIHIAWHALSFWWFSQIDGRGPYPVRKNLEQHLETLKFIAASGKPFEPNIPHHFAFRGSDDVTYVVSAVLAARTAKALGVRHFVLQNMLNTPRVTWGVQDLAKSRALLALTQELEDDRFQVILQPRAGLDYFSPELGKAKEQLAAVSMLMDDIQPHNGNNPPVIHVVSYSEAAYLADPPVIHESIQITRSALEAYREGRRRGDVEDMDQNPEVLHRTQELLSGAQEVLRAIEESVPAPYSAAGLYTIFAAGFLPAPYLWECREEFAQAIRWRTRPVKGGIVVVDENNQPIPSAVRAQAAAEIARTMGKGS